MALCWICTFSSVLCFEMEYKDLKHWILYFYYYKSKCACACAIPISIWHMQKLIYIQYWYFRSHKVPQVIIFRIYENHALCPLDIKENLLSVLSFSPILLSSDYINNCFQNVYKESWYLYFMSVCSELDKQLYKSFFSTLLKLHTQS